MTLALLTLAGGTGAVLRSLVTGALPGPVGTAAVNLAGALAVGIAAGLVDTRSVLGLASFGLLGGFTTFSTWTVDALRLGRSGPAHVTAMLLAGIGLAATGYLLAS